MTGNELRRGSGSTVRWLILVHRYLGIPLSALFVVWFASGIVMMYTRDMPRLTPELRLERLPELDLDRIALAPAAAAGRAHLSPTPRSALLLTVLDRPAYRFDGVTVFADTGERLDAVGPTAATAVASRFTGRPREAVEYVGTLTEPDQWTPGRAERASAAQVRDRRRCRYRALRLATDGRGGDADHAAQPGAGLDRRDSALVLLHGAPREPAALVRRRRLDVDPGVPARRHRPCAGRHAVPVARAARRHPVARRSPGADPVRRLDALALPDRGRVRARDADLGVQRPAVDGALRLDRRPRPGCSPRRAVRRTVGPRALPHVRCGGVGPHRRRATGEGDRAATHPGRSLLRHARRGAIN